jgi:FKBP-type peptidyl-prolyl cis-trans isomerase
MVCSEEATLVPGFREAMLNMNYGDKAMLFVPAHLAYGSQGNGGIPPNTDLIFEMEIVDETDDL